MKYTPGREYGLQGAGVARIYDSKSRGEHNRNLAAGKRIRALCGGEVQRGADQAEVEVGGAGEAGAR
jgi:hypothetical protein